ncbi:hypothetical protein D9V28_01360 [Mycetocola zhadangensis]|uniref:Uncharacterized protein n=1 Tax=Mycetocola zhadangensis TaxID=1164595 RepID=A0A3L7J717_9MICO|nr:hypothetical protein D9V28_01360 [Mycetocola zhadangensis]
MNNALPDGAEPEESGSGRRPDAQRVRRVPGSRRAVLTPVPGTDPTPQARREPILAAEDNEQSWGGRPATPQKSVGANDAQLLADVPPHWG